MDVRLPRLGEGADSGTVAGIFVKEGDRVKKDQPVLELESDKAVASIPSPAAGTISKIHVKEGDEIKVGQLILSLEGDGATAQSVTRQQTHPVEVARAQEEMPELIEAPELEAAEPARPAGVGQPASPSVRKLARELGIDLGKVKGSERGGRIVLEDLKKYVLRLQQLAFQPKAAPQGQAPAPKAALESIDFSKWGPVVKKRMSTLRRTIRSKMVTSWTTIPHITQFDEADITQVMALRKKYAGTYEKKGGRLTLTVFAMKAVVQSLKKHPIFNASIDEVTDEIVFKEYFHIGIAVDTEEGLIVPVVRDVDKKTMLELSIELQELAERTRRRKVSLEEMQGGTFTISNQGGIGSAHFTPIINKPEVAILGIGRGAPKPVVMKNKTVQRTMLPVCLSYDHRVIDGADAARFMVDLVEAFSGVKDADAKI
jgi:pyruvate dehydrogenase E2 component (dihydrolipoamide acetyltransferase)